MATDDGFDVVVGTLDYPMFVVPTTDGRRRAGCLVGFAAQCSISPPRFMVWLSKTDHTFQVAAAAGIPGPAGSPCSTTAPPGSWARSCPGTTAADLGSQLGFQAVRDLSPGNEP